MKPDITTLLWQQEIAKMAEFAYFGFLLFLESVETIFLLNPPHLVENYAYARVKPRVIE
jgi:hypothetical protein